VVLNAGVLGGIEDYTETSVKKAQEIMQVNLWANKQILDLLFAENMFVSQVVAISSGAAVRAMRGWGSYATSKAALNMLIATYASEHPETHFSTIAPGLVDTPMQEEIRHYPEDLRFPSLNVLRKARGTDLMPAPTAVAPRLLESFEKARQQPSGSFLDATQLVPKSFPFLTRVKATLAQSR
jgi:NAD(P)-dependent dehydrogenase (short-subunit alcohol dehydrogenase family)